MGGCRCSYRNCTVKSDGKTHIFHYPVFDKVRCHQWLTNAHRLDFLNLKLSQVKNRVVCQYHFKDDMFMNFKKEKLKLDAIPTEDGPFCDSSKWRENKQTESDKVFTITLADIENDVYLNDKKANFSMKYGDFLTNCEIMDLESFNSTSNNTKIKDTGNSRDLIDLNTQKPQIDLEIGQVYSLQQPSQLVPLYYEQVNRCNEIVAETGQLQCNNIENSLQTIDQNIDIKVLNQDYNNDTMSKKEHFVKSNKIKVMSEERVSKPLCLGKGTLKTVSPSFVLRVPNKKEHKEFPEQRDKTNANIEDANKCNVYLDTTYNVQKHNLIENETNDDSKGIIINSTSEQKQKITTPKKPQISLLNKIAFEKSPDGVVAKNRIPAERIAAIEKKRRFNMKLRDIVEASLQHIEDKEKVIDQSKSETTLVSQHDDTQHLKNFLSKEPELPTSQEYTIAYLEDRMKRMEDTLLSKIEQNTQRIVELKRTIVSDSDKKKKFSISTQTTQESYKKYLYQEISEYLSPEANSLIYEELFINKYARNVSDISELSKRRKLR